MIQFSPVYSPEREDLGAFAVYQSPRAAFDDLCDPVIQVDHFFMSAPYFPPHPHAGFSAVTYVLEDSNGSFANRDSLGDKSTIKPGDLHWTWAGSGIMHEEVPTTPGTPVHGLQIFVNIASAKKHEPPKVFRLSSHDQPTMDAGGVRVKVVTGSIHGLVAPVPLPDPFTLLDLKFDEGASYQLTVPAGWGGVLIPVTGFFEVDSREIKMNESIAFAADASGGGDIEIDAETIGSVIVLMGEQLKQPIAFGGPFVMTTDEELAEAMARYRRGEMGRLKKSF